MGGINKRLSRLERGGETAEEREDRIQAESLSRLSDVDLELIWGYLSRTEEESEEEPSPTECGALLRFFELREEVRKTLPHI